MIPFFFPPLFSGYISIRLVPQIEWLVATKRLSDAKDKVGMGIQQNETSPFRKGSAKLHSSLSGRSAPAFCKGI